MLNVDDLPDRLRTTRLRKWRHSQRDAAKAIGVAQKTISEWERGNALPEPTHYKALAKYLGLAEREVADAIDDERMARSRRTEDPIHLHDIRLDRLETEVKELREEISELAGGVGDEIKTLVAEILAEYQERRRRGGPNGA